MYTMVDGRSAGSQGAIEIAKKCMSDFNGTIYEARDLTTTGKFLTELKATPCMATVPSYLLQVAPAIM